MDWFLGWFYELLYILQKSICYIIDFIREIFLKLVGIERKINKQESVESQAASHPPWLRQRYVLV